MATEDEKTQRLIAETRHNQLVEILKDITIVLYGILAELKPKDEIVEEKKEGE